MDLAKTSAKRYEKHVSLGFGVSYIRYLTVFKINFSNQSLNIHHLCYVYHATRQHVDKTQFLSCFAKHCFELVAELKSVFWDSFAKLLCSWGEGVCGWYNRLLLCKFLPLIHHREGEWGGDERLCVNHDSLMKLSPGKHNAAV